MTTHSNKNQLKLSAREEELMNYFWDKGPLFVKDILEFYDDPKPHFNTISTFVRGLEEKGFVAHHSYGSTYQYYASISREEYSKLSLKGLIGKYFNNSVMSAVSSLVAEEEISIEDLKALIHKVEESNSNNK